ncbi:glutamate--tRNA ligase [Leptolyngbya sp. 'hensonii']|uniref:glutamate--tRNA ligase n=1 Tax=Leptolyngbya sp. 'hensonii' TaxID=1922337 RepID=UPI00094F708D|nr:glutamate--tRNA ligase [Leptolyngbya sp. 'hensonii']OLP19355.1 glutamate--tRNA ligase [Leptolyngbya sp. 'hensonii']
MSVRVRLAPSPTGNLHIGTARTGVFNWLFARHHGGQFILRIEDTDLERSRPEFTQNILDGLTWLGLTWDEGPFFQSKRMDLYKAAIQTLLDQGLAYRAYDTPEELEALRASQTARKQAPRYDNRHRHLSPEQEAAYVAEGRQPVIRFKIDDDREITWTDLVRGPVTWKGSDLGGDMVIARAAMAPELGQPLYNFVVVVDDIDMQITHVIRGEDHIANTAKQILLYEAMGAAVPRFAHTPLILDQGGRKLSKRNGVTSIDDFRKMGYTSEGLVNYMTLLGWSPPDSTQELFRLQEAAQQFDFERVNPAGAKFDWAKLDWINSQYLHRLSVPEMTDLLIPFWQAAGYLFDPLADRPWLEQLGALVGPSLVRLPVSDPTWMAQVREIIGPALPAVADGVEMVRFLFADPFEFMPEAAKQLEQVGSATALQAIVTLLEQETEALTEARAKAILDQVVQAQNLKRGLVMKSLRATLTGQLQGPDLMQSWLLLHQRGQDRPRLQQALTIAK